MKKAWILAVIFLSLLASCGRNTVTQSYDNEWIIQITYPNKERDTIFHRGIYEGETKLFLDGRGACLIVWCSEGWGSKETLACCIAKYKILRHTRVEVNY